MKTLYVFITLKDFSLSINSNSFTYSFATFFASSGSECSIEIEINPVFVLLDTFNILPSISVALFKDPLLSGHSLNRTSRIFKLCITFSLMVLLYKIANIF